MTHSKYEKDETVSSAESTASMTRVRRMRLGGLVCGAAATVAAAIIGSGSQLAGSAPANAAPRPTATVSGATDYASGYNWFNQNLAEPYQMMDAALRTVSSGLGSGNIGTIQAGCSQLQAASDMYRSALPGPDSRANGRLASMVTQLNSAVAECRGLQQGASWSEAKGMLAHVDDARNNLRQAQRILQPYN